MYVYLITNLINNKKYIGITNNYKKRWSNEKLGYKSKRP
jgi:predicted GIY-YIG superfamily endonuclease